MVLGRCFAKATSPENALLRYEQARKQRANAVQIHSRERANALQSSNLKEISAQDEAPTTLVCSGTIQPPCRSESAEPEAFSGKYVAHKHRRWRDLWKRHIGYDCFTERPNGSTRST